LLASISHDLRTPLAVIAAASSALNDPHMNFDSDARHLLTASIESKANEMTDIISNVLELMRLETGQVALRRDWQSADDLLSGALARCEGRLANYPVKDELPVELPPVFVDSSLIVQVFANILENVARHTPPGTQATVSAQAEEGALRICVDDHGPGFPQGDPERLFAKFHRGRDEGNTGGAGLGLTICRAIVNAHGGSISAMPRPGGGARITFTLPTG
jgi:two-component system sensor histidine kinase KdpD